MSFRIDQLNGILQFQITRPHIHNAVNHEVIEGLTLFIERMKQPDVHFGVITGEGDKAFCSGGDLSVFHSLVTEAEAWEVHNRMAMLLYELAVQPVPVIALINGTAIGGGAEIASACDYRLIKKTAKAGFVQGRLAITSGWGGTTLLHEKGMRYDHLLQLTTEAEPLPADRLVDIGWATEVYDGDKWAALSKFVHKMKAHHPTVAKAYKELLTTKLREAKVKERILNEARQCAVLWEKEPHHAAVAQFLNRKK
ncbi:enoyl-CoA hydratase/isomerase family protein [Chryseomicrobium palamuruense]|uniref:Ethylmalonyl-CoA decarboxylase n=1 Tax=Chryseomicrobium palamuruense TaxID=682973 RepID=A0ABV8UU62_9BACL